MSRKVFITSAASEDERLLRIAQAGTIEGQVADLIWERFLCSFDDWGRADLAPLSVWKRLFAGNPLVTPQLVEGAIALYIDEGLLLAYEAGGKRYMGIDPAKWFRYQTHIRREKRADDKESNFPPQPGWAEYAAAQRVAIDAGGARESEESRTIAQPRADARNLAHSRADARIPAPERAPANPRARSSPSPSLTIPPDSPGEEISKPKGSLAKEAPADERPEAAPPVEAQEALLEEAKRRHAEAQAKAKAKAAEEAARVVGWRNAFQAAWADPARVKRSGADSRADAEAKFLARCKEGHDPAVMLDGWRLYWAWCSVTGKDRTELAMQAARFFGPGHHWEEAWDLPAEGVPAARASPIPLTGREKAAAMNREFFAKLAQEAANAHPA